MNLKMLERGTMYEESLLCPDQISFIKVAGQADIVVMSGNFSSKFVVTKCELNIVVTFLQLCIFSQSLKMHLFI
jgi:hypothetical protein